MKMRTICWHVLQVNAGIWPHDLLIIHSYKLKDEQITTQGQIINNIQETIISKKIVNYCLQVSEPYFTMLFSK